MLRKGKWKQFFLRRGRSKIRDQSQVNASVCTLCVGTTQTDVGSHCNHQQETLPPPQVSLDAVVPIETSPNNSPKVPSAGILKKFNSGSSKPVLIKSASSSASSHVHTLNNEPTNEGKDPKRDKDSEEKNEDFMAEEADSDLLEHSQTENTVPISNEQDEPKGGSVVTDSTPEDSVLKRRISFALNEPTKIFETPPQEETPETVLEEVLAESLPDQKTKDKYPLNNFEDESLNEERKAASPTANDNWLGAKPSEQTSSREEGEANGYYREEGVTAEEYTVQNNPENQIKLPDVGEDMLPSQNEEQGTILGQKIIDQVGNPESIDAERSNLVDPNRIPPQPEPLVERKLSKDLTNHDGHTIETSIATSEIETVDTIRPIQLTNTSPASPHHNTTACEGEETQAEQQCTVTSSSSSDKEPSFSTNPTIPSNNIGTEQLDESKSGHRVQVDTRMVFGSLANDFSDQQLFYTPRFGAQGICPDVEHNIVSGEDASNFKILNYTEDFMKQNDEKFLDSNLTTAGQVIDITDLENNHFHNEQEQQFEKGCESEQSPPIVEAEEEFEPQHRIDVLRKKTQN